MKDIPVTRETIIVLSILEIPVVIGHFIKDGTSRVRTGTITDITRIESHAGLVVVTDDEKEERSVYVQNIFFLRA